MNKECLSLEVNIRVLVGCHNRDGIEDGKGIGIGGIGGLKSWRRKDSAGSLSACGKAVFKIIAVI